MTIEDVPLVLFNALRMLEREALQEAALVPMASREHAFYRGVVAAAQDRLHPVRREAHGDVWLAAETSAFRNGYLEASDAIAAAGHGPVRLPLPTP